MPADKEDVLTIHYGRGRSKWDRPERRAAHLEMLTLTTLGDVVGDDSKAIGMFRVAYDSMRKPNLFSRHINQGVLDRKALLPTPHPGHKSWQNRLQHFRWEQLNQDMARSHEGVEIVT